MGQDLQALNHKQRLAEWGKRVEAWRSSGQTVSAWCKENGIAVSTYFEWQRKVFRAVSGEAEPHFAEVPVVSTRAESSGRTAVIRAGEVEIELCSGADAETIRAIVQALRSC